ncbi:MAG: phosphogluconate dehydratase [Hyphomicrobiales bacterium]|nr:phosphogluconate dehydratase [Hyphomicrobiales bacterium]MBV8441244.1 phosphogluconate dehydratase [Hyphomicrobiales bacterium]
MTQLNARVGEATERIERRSRATRQAYLDRIDAAVAKGPTRKRLGCANFAHGFAACAPGDKEALRDGSGPNLAIVTAYNDMLSAHQPYARFPDLIKEAARAAGGSAQVAGGVPAMCDGVTQGEKGMDLSLFSRDVIALSTAVALSHDMFDAAVYLGICDKIVPGLLIGALSFGHLPAVFLPAGPMPSGLANDDKSKIRQLYAEGKATRAELLAAEAAAYHAPGTCTFYGTANTNQMLMEIMGLHLPGASFVNPNTPLRDALTTLGVRRALELTALGNHFTPIGHVIDERAVVNGAVGLHATGGSTNLTIHLIAMAAAAGIALTWEDFADLAEVTPLMTRIYPNGKADVNHFQAAGGMGLLIRELLGAGLLHDGARTVWGDSLADYAVEPRLDADGSVSWTAAPARSGDPTVLRKAADPFQPTGGLRVLEGPLGRAVIKTSAVASDRHVIEAPARVFHSQEELHAAFRAGELDCDFVAVVRFQGPKAIGMPELHKLMPPLGVLQDRGRRVALVTDGRLSGASGKVPSAIHVTPEAAAGGPIAKIRDGDIIRLDATNGRLEVKAAGEDWGARTPVEADLSAAHVGVGRELFGAFRASVSAADEGAAIFRAA